MKVRRFVRWAGVGLAAQLALGCSAILGIEPLKELGGAGGHAGEVAESLADSGAGGAVAGRAGASARAGRGGAGAAAHAGGAGSSGVAGASDAAESGDAGASAEAGEAGSAGRAGTGGRAYAADAGTGAASGAGTGAGATAGAGAAAGAAAGTGAASGTGAAAGTGAGATAGAGAAAGAGAGAGAGGKSAAGGGGQAGATGEAGDAGSSGQAGMAGRAGAAGSSSALSAVHGKVVDTRGRPVANAQVQIGALDTTTDATGTFSLDAVPETYDVGLLIVETVSAKAVRNAWLFEGLRRRDPTLQIYPAPSAHFSHLSVHASGASSPLPAGQQFYAAFGSPDADFEETALEPSKDFSSSYWSGPAQISGNVHVLLAKNAEPDAPPSEFLAYDTQPVTLLDQATVDVTASLAGPPVTFGTVSGSVTSHGGSRADWFVLRFEDGTSLSTSLSDAGPSDRFSLVAPNIAAASLAVVSMEGSVVHPPYAVGFVDGVTVGSSDNEIAIPAPPQLVAPGDGQTAVDTTTSFEWLGTGHVFVLHFLAKDTSDELFVVTSKKQGGLPARGRVPYVAAANAQFTWRVEWHGDLAASVSSVDDAAGPAGFLSAFWRARLHGPRRGAGSYAASEDRTFTTAP